MRKLGNFLAASAMVTGLWAMPARAQDADLEDPVIDSEATGEETREPATGDEFTEGDEFDQTGREIGEPEDLLQHPPPPPGGGHGWPGGPGGIGPLGPVVFPLWRCEARPNVPWGTYNPWATPFWAVNFFYMTAWNQAFKNCQYQTRQWCQVWCYRIR